MPVEPAKAQMFQLMMEAEALSFGSFTLKSGRISPYFFNSARFQTGALVAALGDHYARVIAEQAPGTTIVFGPAYKGIPLCVATAIALSRRVSRPVGYLFNRKEEKTHGDRGLFVGQSPGAQDRLAMVDDVITDGGTKLEAVELLRGSFTAPVDLLVIAFDRMEQGQAGQDAIAEFQKSTGIPVHALFTLDDLEDALGSPAGRTAGVAPQEFQARLREYRRQYGLPARPRG